MTVSTVATVTVCVVGAELLRWWVDGDDDDDQRRWRRWTGGGGGGVTRVMRILGGVRRGAGAAVAVTGEVGRCGDGGARRGGGAVGVGAAVRVGGQQRIYKWATIVTGGGVGWVGGRRAKRPRVGPLHSLSSATHPCHAGVSNVP